MSTTETEAGAAGEDRSVLETVRATIADLLTEMGERPDLLRVQAGEVVVELRWNEASRAASAPVGTLAPPRSDEPGGRQDGEQPGEEVHHVCAPTVGTFYRSPEPGADPFVSEGDLVRAGQQVGIIEAMKLLIPIEADVSGRVVQVLRDDATPVEYGEPLFAVVPAEAA